MFFKAEDPEGLAAWYEEHLGVYRDEEGYTVFGWRDLHTGRPGGTVWAAFPSETEYFDPSDGDWMVNYRVDDLDAALQHLEDAGARIVGEPETFDYGRFGWALDPEGNKFELWEPPDEPAFETTVPRRELESLSGEWLCEPGTTLAAGEGMSDDVLVVETEVRLELDELWELWTTSDGLSRWLVGESRVELRVGGPYELYFDTTAPPGQRGSEGCRILSFLPRRMLSFTWNAPPHLDYARRRMTHVVLEFTPNEEGTHLRLSHLGWPSDGEDDHAQWSETWEYFESAWESVFAALGEVAEDSDG
ncbi:MAG: SRPBCC domain-containing protein [Halobacteriales archaeon]|nr:SRPBCC domain-containing protein [Halobacteriales archaeon]